MSTAIKQWKVSKEGKGFVIVESNKDGKLTCSCADKKKACIHMMAVGYANLSKDYVYILNRGGKVAYRDYVIELINKHIQTIPVISKENGFWSHTLGDKKSKQMWLTIMEERKAEIISEQYSDFNIDEAIDSVKAESKRPTIMELIKQHAIYGAI